MGEVKQIDIDAANELLRVVRTTPTGSDAVNFAEHFARHREAATNARQIDEVWNLLDMASGLMSPGKAHDLVREARDNLPTTARDAANVGRDEINRIFNEGTLEQSIRIGVPPRPDETPGEWRDRVRKEAILSALRAQPSEDYRRGIEDAAKVLLDLATDEEVAMAGMNDNETAYRARCAIIAKELRRAGKKVRALAEKSDESHSIQRWG
jgi:hypothetical protein